MYWRYSGYYLMLTGVIHNIIGLLMGYNVIVDMCSDGLWNTIEQAGTINFQRSALLWFLLVGCFWILMGYLMQQWLKQQKPLPSVLGYGFIILGTLVAVVLPVSGAWLFLPQGLIILFSQKKLGGN